MKKIFFRLDDIFQKNNYNEKSQNLIEMSILNDLDFYTEKKLQLPVDK